MFLSGRPYKLRGGGLHVHHAYIGLFLMAWSLAVIFFRVGVIGEYNPWLAWGGLVLGMVLFIHDVLWHVIHRKKR